MTSSFSPKPTRRTTRTLGVGLGLGLALLANLGDRAFSANANNGGIDPLEILNTAVKNNILFIVDTSGSMAGTPQDENDIVGGDDPASRFYQTKRAVRDVITANTGKANFGLATFHPDYTEHRMDGNQGLVYVTQDPTGDLYRNNFTGGGSALTDQCSGASCTTTESTQIFQNLASNNAGTSTPYPDGCTPQAMNQVGVGGLTNPPITHVLGSPATNAEYTANNLINSGSNCRYYVKSKLMLNQRRYSVRRGAASTAAILSSSSSITCPPPPPGLLGDDVASTNDGSKQRACFQLQDATSALAITQRSSLYSSSNTSSYTASTTWTPAANSLLIAFVTGSIASSPTDPTSVTGHGVTYTKLTLLPSSNALPAASATHAVSVWVAKAGASPTSAAAVVTFASNRTGGVLVEYAAVGADVSGTAQSAVLQANTLAGSGGSVSSTLGAAGSASNGVMFFVTHLANEGTAGLAPGWTEGNEGSHNNPNTGVQVQYANSFIANATASWSTSPSAWRTVHLEIKALPATNAITTYWLTGTNFDYVSVTPTVQPDGSTSTNNCAQSGVNVDVADCGVDNAQEINSYMRMELQYDGVAGAPRDVPALTSLANRKPNIGESPPFSLDVTPPVSAPFTNPGIRQGNGTPLAATMAFALNYFRTTVLPAAGTLKRPVAAIGKQKQFVILLTDGNESCGGTPTTAAYNLWSNTLPALPACTGTCLSSKGITADQYAVANRIELLLVTFAGGSATNVNNISQAGTGKNGTTCTKLYPGSTDTTLAPCRTAFIANNIDELVNALNAAINTSTATGEFSDQQSVTETVFEFANYATPTTDPLDPEERYSVSVPILMQSTFELPLYKGHLNAFRRDGKGTTVLTDDTSEQMWDAGQKLYDRVSNATTGMGTGLYTFAQLYGNANNPSPTNMNNPLNTTAKIKRRIFTTVQNGVNPDYTPQKLLNKDALLAWTRVPLWPPTTGTADNTFIAPADTSAVTVAEVKGRLDTAMGFDLLTTVAQVQAAVPGACQGTVSANIHDKCTSATVAIALSRAKREAREIVLAYLAGAQLEAVNGVPVRTTGDELQYKVREWVMVESTLAAPGVVTAPLLAGPKSGGLGFDEYKFYRDGLKLADGESPDQVNGVANNGLGLRSPDRGASAAQSAVAAPNTELKPSMSVVYHATNQGLHAFRAGPCPSPLPGSGIGTPPPRCDTPVAETGGEELWTFVPFDQLSKLAALTKTQSRSNKQYLLAAPVRFSDVFVPGSATYAGKGFTGVWRTLLFFGRGRGGKYYTALDVTTPGPFTRHSLATDPPTVVWSRGNPDTTSGVAGGTPNNIATDVTAYAKMGETWSVPAVGYVTAATYTTSRKAFGTDFVLFTGSGYSDVASEGKTFFVLDALTGDIVRAHDVADGSPAYPLPTPSPLPLPTPTTVLTNFLVASPVAYSEDTDGNSPSGYRFIGNPITAKTKTVYFGDLHSRIFRFDVTSPPAVSFTYGTSNAFFAASTGSVGNQPFATAVSVLQNRPDSTLAGDILIYAESGHDSRVLPQSSKPFKAYAFKDTNGVRTDVFSRDFGANFRGTVQPAAAFAGTAFPPTPVVFFAATRFTGACVSTFDSVLVALKGITTVPNVPEAAFVLTSNTSDDDTEITIAGTKVNAVRVSGEGNLVIDQGLQAQNAPPPPGVPVASETTSTSSSLVSLGLVPGSQAYKDLAATTVPYRIGSSVCRIDQ